MWRKLHQMWYSPQNGNRWVTFTLAWLGTVAISAICASLMTILTMHDTVYLRGVEHGAEAAMTSLDVKQLMLDDPQFANAACTAWWFGSNWKERTLTKPARK